MDKAALIARRIPERDVVIPGVGTVRVRGLTRAEALLVRHDVDGEVEKERMILALTMLDPPMTVEDASAWQDGSPAGEIEPITDVVMELSGMVSGSAKRAVKDFVADPELEFRVLPGAEAGDDGGDAAGADVG